MRKGRRVIPRRPPVWQPLLCAAGQNEASKLTSPSTPI